MTGEARNVVQTGSAQNITIGGASNDRLGVIGLAIVAGLLVVAVVVVAALTLPSQLDPDRSAADTGGGRTTSDAGNAQASGPPVAAVSSYLPVGCRSGWVVPDRGDEPIPYSPRKPPTGAVLGSGGEITVTVQGLTSRSAVLQSMTVDVVRRSPAVAGVYLPLGCQGEVPPRRSRLDLDAPAPLITPEPGSVSFPYKVNDVEPEQFVITPEVTTGDIEWRLLLKWTSGTDQGELVVDDSGKPFRTTAATAARQFCFDSKTSVWRSSC